MEFLPEFGSDAGNLRREIGISRGMLYRYVEPAGQLQNHAKRVLKVLSDTLNAVNTRYFRSGLFQFRQTPAGVVRLLCRYCGVVVSARGFQRRDQAEIAKVGDVIRDAIAKGGPELDLVTKASRFFWAPTSDGAPYITALGLPLPYGRRPSASTGIAPLMSLSPAWWAVTIAAITELLFGLVDEKPRLPSFPCNAFGQFERGHTAPDLQAPPQMQMTSAVKLRPEPEYRKLASDIIYSQAWKSLPQKSGRARNRAIGKLMLRALNDG